MKRLVHFSTAASLMMLAACTSPKNNQIDAFVDALGKQRNSAADSVQLGMKKARGAATNTEALKQQVTTYQDRLKNNYSDAKTASDTIIKRLNDWSQGNAIDKQSLVFHSERIDNSVKRLEQLASAGPHGEPMSVIAIAPALAVILGDFAKSLIDFLVTYDKSAANAMKDRISDATWGTWDEVSKER